ncbi:MAG: carboxymuconolactone decarboxylase family protein [Acidimicrobiales bacterium]
MTRADTEREIKDTLGLVPSFFDGIPTDVIEAEWELFKRFEFGDTHIPTKYKQLMGVALHSYTHCSYCTLFHTEAARLNGATDAEIQEAAHFAKHSAGWSTYMNGTRQSFDTFAKELHEVEAYLSSN